MKWLRRVCGSAVTWSGLKRTYTVHAQRRSMPLILTIALVALVATPKAPAAAEPDTGLAGDPVVHTGKINGVAYRVEVPVRWNGDLLLYSHGYRAPGADNSATVAPSSPDLSGALRVALLERGYALAGSAYGTTGWAVQDALDDQVRLLDWFHARVGRPRHTYAWGNSMGGLTSVLLAERNPRRFSGVLALCGDLAGAVAEYNSRLDLAYAIKTLLAPGSDLQIARIGDGDANKARFDLVIGQALRTAPAGQARLALANALADIPGWFDSHTAAPTEVADQVLAQYVYDIYVIGSGIWGPGRAELERRAGGNPSWNVGVDYRRIFARSSQKALVEQAYRAAGLNLDADLATLNAGDRIIPDPSAVAYLARYGTPLGLTHVPVATMHTIGDGGVPVEHEREYADRVHRVAGPHRLRQVYLARGFHCAFSPAEVLAVLDALVRRVNTGEWGDTSPTGMNAAAAVYPAPAHQVWSWWDNSWADMAPGFLAYYPHRLPRACSPPPNRRTC
jgi:hypothetical protein